VATGRRESAAPAVADLLRLRAAGNAVRGTRDAADAHVTLEDAQRVAGIAPAVLHDVAERQIDRVRPRREGGHTKDEADVILQSEHGVGGVAHAGGIDIAQGIGFRAGHGEMNLIGAPGRRPGGSLRLDRQFAHGQFRRRIPIEGGPIVHEESNRVAGQDARAGGRQRRRRRHEEWNLQGIVVGAAANRADRRGDSHAIGQQRLDGSPRQDDAVLRDRAVDGDVGQRQRRRQRLRNRRHRRQAAAQQQAEAGRNQQVDESSLFVHSAPLLWECGMMNAECGTTATTDVARIPHSAFLISDTHDHRVPAYE
jgi:hypothetical protein